MAYDSERYPTEIRQKNSERSVEITWDDGKIFEYTMEYLRVACPCADCRGHTPSQRKLIDGKQDVTIERILPVGHYAVKIIFSDGHDTGVYSWDVFWDLGENRERHWLEYIFQLEATGKSREVCTLATKGGCSGGGCKG